MDDEKTIQQVADHPFTQGLIDTMKAYAKSKGVSLKVVPGLPLDQASITATFTLPPVIEIMPSVHADALAQIFNTVVMTPVKPVRDGLKMGKVLMGDLLGSTVMQVTELRNGQAVGIARLINGDPPLTFDVAARQWPNGYSLYMPSSTRGQKPVKGDVVIIHQHLDNDAPDHFWKFAHVERVLTGAVEVIIDFGPTGPARLEVDAGDVYTRVQQEKVKAPDTNEDGHVRTVTTKAPTKADKRRNMKPGAK